MSYQPRNGSLAERVCRYFLQHRDEELGTKDIALKFDVEAVSVHSSLAEAVNSRYLTRTGGRGGQTYGAGANIDKALPPPSAANGRASPFPSTPGAKASRTQRVLPELDVAAVSVEASVPVPSTGPKRRGPQWEVLLDRLQQPGQHSSPLPIEFKDSLKGAVAKWVKAHEGHKFTVAKVSTTHMRIWRTA